MKLCRGATARTMLSIILTAAACAACGSASPDSVATLPSSESEVERGPLPPQPELAFDEASELGLVNSEAIAVTGPSNAYVDGRRATVTVEVELPPTASRATSVDVRSSGDCIVPPMSRRKTLSVPAGSTVVFVSQSARPLDGSRSCVLRTEVVVPGRPETGAGLTTTVWGS